MVAYALRFDEAYVSNTADTRALEFAIVEPIDCGSKIGSSLEFDDAFSSAISIALKVHFTVDHVYICRTTEVFEVLRYQ